MKAEKERRGWRGGEGEEERTFYGPFGPERGYEPVLCYQGQGVFGPSAAADALTFLRWGVKSIPHFYTDLYDENCFRAMRRVLKEKREDPIKGEGAQGSE